MKSLIFFFLSLVAFYACTEVELPPHVTPVTYKVIASEAHIMPYGKRRSRTEWIMAVKNVKTGEMSAKNVDYLTYVKYKEGSTVVFNDWVGYTAFGIIIQLLMFASVIVGFISLIVMVISAINYAIGLGAMRGLNW